MPLLLLSLFACRSDPPADRPNVLVIDIDTLSAERLGGTRNGQPVTPTLDALAARSVRFTQAISHSGWTLPALSSLLTGRLPVVLRADDRGVPWRPKGSRDAAEILKIYGYHTAAFWGVTLPGPMSDTAWPSFDLNSVHTEQLSAPPTDDVLSWLTTTEEPFFGYVHDIDLHDPNTYRTPDHRLAFDPPELDVPSAGAWRSYYEALVPTLGHDAAADATIAHHLGVLHLYDAAVARILDALKTRGLDGRTVVVVTSDHGEDFFDHALGDHGQLYDTLLKVPLIWADPVRSPMEIPEQVEGIDLAPTILARAGVPADASMEGRSLLGRMQGEAWEERPVFSVTEDCHASLRTPAWKLMFRDQRPRGDRAWGPAGGKNHLFVNVADAVARHGIREPMPDCSTPERPVRTGPKPRDLILELYDLASDPREYTSVVDTHPEVVAELLPPLLGTLAMQKGAVVDADRQPLRPDQVKALQDGGYWGMVDGGGPPGKDGPPRPPPPGQPPKPPPSGSAPP